LHEKKGKPLGYPTRIIQIACKKIGSQKKGGLNIVEKENRPDNKYNIQKCKGNI